MIVLRLAEQYYHQPGLAERALKRSESHIARSKSVDPMGELRAGKLDYIWSYSSVAEAAGFRYVSLPSEIDLSDPADSAQYARASVRVAGKSTGDTVTFTGEPIIYGFSIPKHAPHPQLAASFAAFLLSGEGRRILRREHLEALEKPVLVGTQIPEVVRKVVK